MDDMEIQREAIIEIAGTQYEGRVSNHQPSCFNQNLILKHQSDNPYDHNAVLLLTDDGKELGFLPKGYASLYAPAIDSDRYNFNVKIVKSEPDSERPILIVKITSDLKNRSEEIIERGILDFVQDIVNGYAQQKAEYLNFIYSETVNVNILVSALNKVRLIHKLHSILNDIIVNYNIQQSSAKYMFLDKEPLTKNLSNLKADVNDVLKKIQKSYNESLDIEDEEEYHRVQSEIREKRKKFRLYDDLLSLLLDAIGSYTNISIVAQSPHIEISDVEAKLDNSVSNDAMPIEEHSTLESSISPTVNTSKTKPILLDRPLLTEQSFLDWLISDGGVSETIAKQYISNIHSIEKLYQTLYGVRKNILGANSADNVKTMIETLLQRSEYIDANDRRHNSFSASLNKFAQFADISVKGLKSPAEKKNYQSPINSEPFVIKTVDFDNPHNCTYYKPCSFVFNELKYSVGNWCELYTKFLTLLYTDTAYAEVLKGLIGKSLYGHRIDFADKILTYKLRRVIRISSDFFAEGNLSAIDIIKHIKRLMELCSIDDSQMVIEYITQKQSNESVESNDSDNAMESYNRQLAASSESSILTQSLPADNSATEIGNRFTEWLINISGLAPATAKSYYSSVKTSERIAKEQNLKSQRLFSAHNYEEADETFNELLKCDAFIKTNAAAHNSLTAGVRKLLQYFRSTKETMLQESIKAEKTNIQEKVSPVQAHFTPDTSKPFVLKEAVIEILSSDASEITKYHEHKNGISSKNLRELIKEYYRKTIGLFEISKLLMLDRTFQSVGKGCYILNKDLILYSAESESVKSISVTEEKPVAIKPVKENANTTHVPVIENQISATAESPAESELNIEKILEVIKENSNNLQYEDGFGAYEVKTLLYHKGITNASEEQIETLMSECSELQEVEEGYYFLADEEKSYEIITEPSAIMERTENDIEIIDTIKPDTSYQEPQEINNDERFIVLKINGNTMRAYDYSDALNKVCEFSINCKPFKMARIAGQGIQFHGKSVFYRTAVPVYGYNKLSNGLQIIAISTLSDLQMITAAVQKYCQIDDDMITIISY